MKTKKINNCFNSISIISILFFIILLLIPAAATSDPCTDADDDGFSIEGGVCGEVDCDDTDPEIYPGAPEICDGKINDCDNPMAKDGSDIYWDLDRS